MNGLMSFAFFADSLRLMMSPLLIMPYKMLSRLFFPILPSPIWPSEAAAIQFSSKLLYMPLKQMLDTGTKLYLSANCSTDSLARFTFSIAHLSLLTCLHQLLLQ